MHSQKLKYFVHVIPVQEDCFHELRFKYHVKVSSPSAAPESLARYRNYIKLVSDIYRLRKMVLLWFTDVMFWLHSVIITFWAPLSPKAPGELKEWTGSVFHGRPSISTVSNDFSSEAPRTPGILLPYFIICLRQGEWTFVHDPVSLKMIGTMYICRQKTCYKASGT